MPCTIFLEKYNLFFLNQIFLYKWIEGGGNDLCLYSGKGRARGVEEENKLSMVLCIIMKR